MLTYKSGRLMSTEVNFLWSESPGPCGKLTIIHLGTTKTKAVSMKKRTQRLVRHHPKKIKGGFGNMTTCRTFPATRPRLGRTVLTKRKLHSGVLSNSEVAGSFWIFKALDSASVLQGIHYSRGRFQVQLILAVRSKFINLVWSIDLVVFKLSLLFIRIALLGRIKTKRMSDRFQQLFLGELERSTAHI